MLSENAWNWGSKGAFLYLGTCAILTVYFFFCLPETRNRSFGEIELLFENKVPARKFAKTKVDQFQTVTAVGTIYQPVAIAHINANGADDDRSIDEKKSSRTTLQTTTTNDEE